MAEKEYIEREAVLDHLNKIWETTDNWYEEDTPESPENMIRCVESIPAADVVEVVRCENCKNCAMVIDLVGDPHLFCELSKNKAEVQFGDF